MVGNVSICRPGNGCLRFCKNVLPFAPRQPNAAYTTAACNDKTSKKTILVASNPCLPPYNVPGTCICMKFVFVRGSTGEGAPEDSITYIQRAPGPGCVAGCPLSGFKFNQKGPATHPSMYRPGHSLYVGGRVPWANRAS